MIRVRWSNVGFEGFCDGCRSWWPITGECWPKKGELKICTACLAILRAPVWMGGSWRKYQKAGGLMEYADWRREYNRQWMETHRLRKRMAA